jgi:hypothetical protein
MSEDSCLIMDSNFDMVPLKLRPEIVAGAKLTICKKMA